MVKSLSRGVRGLVAGVVWLRNRQVCKNYGSRRQTCRIPRKFIHLCNTAGIADLRQVLLDVISGEFSIWHLNTWNPPRELSHLCSMVQIVGTWPSSAGLVKSLGTPSSSPNLSKSLATLPSLKTLGQVCGTWASPPELDQVSVNFVKFPELAQVSGNFDKSGRLWSSLRRGGPADFWLVLRGLGFDRSVRITVPDDRLVEFQKNSITYAAL